MAHESKIQIESQGHHITPPSAYLGVYIILIVLMAATVGASYLHIGVFNNALAMVIAVTKATLVVLVFMQVRYGTRLIWMWAGLGFVWFTLLSIILQDYVTRDWVRVIGW